MGEQHYLWIVKGKNFRKYLVTFLFFLAAVAFVVALAFLITGSRADLWLTGHNGVSRETMFPFVFTSDKELYVMNSDNEVYPIDDGVTDSIHDTSFEKVYYTRYHSLYEYSIKSNTRKLLCSNVDKYFIFSDRKSIIFTQPNGSVCIYKYSGSEVFTLFDASLEENSTTSLISTAKGASHFAFLLANGSESKVGTLYVIDLNGSITTISEKVNISDSFDFFTDDNAIAYYSESELIIHSLVSGNDVSFKNGYYIKEQAKGFAVNPCTTIENYDASADIYYVVHDLSEETGLGVLSYVNANKLTIKVKEICPNVSKVVGYDSENTRLLYTVTSGERINIFSTQKGNAGRLIASNVDLSCTLFFDADTASLFIKTQENVLYLIDINNRKLTQNIVAYDAERVYPYAEQDIVSIHYVNSPMKSILINKNRVETYSILEERLFGKYNGKYLMCRQNPSGFTLDYVKDNEMTRISTNCLRTIFFDKDIEKVIFLEDGIMKLWTPDGIKDIGEFPEGIESITVYSSK